MKVYRQRLSLLLAITLFASSAYADTIQTIGIGSAVITVDGSADFESFAALYDNPYSEGGMLFSRTGLTFNNNGCGYASQDNPVSCSPAFPGFSGNYMYGMSTGDGGYFEITAGGGNTFRGLEFVLGSGFGPDEPRPVAWASYDAGNNLISSGSFFGVMGTVVGFSDSSGFATLRYTSGFDTSADFSTTFNAPAFDTVRADFTQFSTQSVPDSATTSSLFGIGIAGLLLARYRVRKRSGL